MGRQIIEILFFIIFAGTAITVEENAIAIICVVLAIVALMFLISDIKTLRDQKYNLVNAYNLLLCDVLKNYRDTVWETADKEEEKRKFKELLTELHNNGFNTDLLLNMMNSKSMIDLELMAIKRELQK
jgi:hypothetical protein